MSIDRQDPGPTAADLRRRVLTELGGDGEQRPVAERSVEPEDKALGAKPPGSVSAGYGLDLGSIQLAQNFAPIVWCDVETTGLDPDWDQLLEVAFVVTDEFLEPRGIYHQVVHCPELLSMIPTVYDMHQKSGLLDEVRSPGALSLSEISEKVLHFFKLNGVTALSPLAGSTIHFDRGFLSTNLSTVHDAIHYRNVDVSSFREVVKRWRPDSLWQKGDVHRALPDVLDSINQLRHYRRAFGLD